MMNLYSGKLEKPKEREKNTRDNFLNLCSVGVNTQTTKGMIDFSQIIYRKAKAHNLEKKIFKI